MYWKYATRSLARGGQRTLLAIFCVAVGVMAIVSLQLVGNMVDNALTSNIREGNGGDVAVRSDFAPLRQSQLSTFDNLKSQGVITDYTAVVSMRAFARDASGTAKFLALYAADPATFPLTGAPHFSDPANGTFTDLLHDNQIVVTDLLLQQLNLHKGDSITINATNAGRTVHATIAGVLRTGGFFNSPAAVISLSDYQASPSTSGLPAGYNAIYANVPGHTDAAQATAKKAIQDGLQQSGSQVTVTTIKDALADNQQQVGFIRNFLQIVGLLALLIGGVGIINTMQVMLRRRRIEIAMLKTTGYRQLDLYSMFGLEAALLGVLGGVVGALAGIGVSFLVRNIVERAIVVTLPAVIDPVTVALGVAIGLFTALIFGIMPIVQSSRVRPQEVLREQPEGTSAATIALSIFLVALLSVLFFALAAIILGDVKVALAAVLGTGVFLFVLSLVFTGVVYAISSLPVLESFTGWYLLLVLVATALSLLIAIQFRTLGVIFLAISLLGLLVVVLPRTVKVNLKMALRNIGRSRGRTVTTLVALYIGIFAIGLILALGQNIKNEINTVLTKVATYNSFVIAGTGDRSAVDAQVSQLRGLQGQVINTIAIASPLSVDGTPVADILKSASEGGSGTSTARSEALAYLSTPEGYDLATGSVPKVTIIQGRGDPTPGHNLSKDDAGKNNVILPLRASLAPLHAHVGTQIVLLGPDGKTTETVTVVGFYTGISFVGGGMYADNSLVHTLSGGHETLVYSLILNPRDAKAQLDKLSQAVPTVTTFSIVDVTIFINDLLNNLIVMLTALASLAMFAGIVIIANAVALAMLERRRELGILKAVGHTSSDVLGEVLIENSIIGFTGGLLAMLLVTAALTLLDKLIFKSGFGVSTVITLGIITASAAVCMVVAALVAWPATRVRPIEVLRYE
jgi:predicted lysophospholipase L1 biosynthesis ABC-type transport system permease subunit